MGTLHLVFLTLVLVAGVVEGQGQIYRWDYFYRQQWGGDHLTVTPDGNRVELLLDEFGGGAGFVSKDAFLSGIFYIRMKLPVIKSPGVIASFFLSGERSREGETIVHDEVDFEFIGTYDQPVLQTNIFANDMGAREQTFNLWFDPTADFHSYEIMWGADQIVFFVDSIPIRFFKNKSKDGVNFPTSVMSVEASLWNGTWAHIGTVDWSKGPFRVQYDGWFNNFACKSTSGPETCRTIGVPRYFWNSWIPSPKELADYENVQKNYLIYNYCNDRPKKECEFAD